MKVVLDTNVLLAGVATHGLCESVVALILRDHTLVLSEYILDEFEEHYIGKFKATAEHANAAAKTFRRQSKVVEPAHIAMTNCNDPDDLPILGTAKAGQATYLVTGDQGLLDLVNFEGIPIVAPREFYELIRDKS